MLPACAPEKQALLMRCRLEPAVPPCPQVAIDLLLAGLLLQIRDRCVPRASSERGDE